MYQPKMDLSTDTHPLFSEKILNDLRKVPATTTLEFLQAKREEISRQTDLTHSQVNLIRDAILARHAAQIQTGFQYLQAMRDDPYISSGIKNFDSLLGGGFRCGDLYELCGLSSTGKSQICMTTAATIIGSSPHHVFYIDSKRDLFIERLLANPSLKSSSKARELLRRLLVSRPSTVYDLITVLHEYINQQRATRPRLLIIDSLATLLFQHLSDQTKSLSLLSSIKSLLNYIAVEMQAAILVTNVLTWQSDEAGAGDDKDSMQYQKAALGKFWSHAPTTRINTTRLGGNNVLLTVTKSSNIPIGKSVTVNMNENGVC